MFDRSENEDPGAFWFGLLVVLVVAGCIYSMFMDPSGWGF